MSPLLPHVLAEKECLESFLAALAEEDRAISERRFAELPIINEQKIRLLARMAEIDNGRESVQVQLGLEPGRAGTDAAAMADEALHAAWAGLLVLAGRTRELNRRVAAKVHTHLEFTSNALHFLRPGGQALYDRAGARK
jgi:flagellar biosynthesis protein FlgN